MSKIGKWLTDWRTPTASTQPFSQLSSQSAVSNNTIHQLNQHQLARAGHLKLLFTWYMWCVCCVMEIDGTGWRSRNLQSTVLAWDWPVVAWSVCCYAACLVKHQLGWEKRISVRQDREMWERVVSVKLGYSVIAS